MTGRKSVGPIVPSSVEFETPVKGPEQVHKLLPRPAGARPGVHDGTKKAVDADDDTMPYVAFTDTERLIGDGAKNQHSESTVFDAERSIGPKFAVPSVQSKDVSLDLQRAHDRLHCALDCPLLNRAYDLEADGDLAGALAALNRHRTHQCQWARSPWP